MDATELVDRYCEAWSQADPKARATLLASVWAPGGSYCDPTVLAANEHELLRHIATVNARRPGARVKRKGRVDVHHGIARFAWHVVTADGTSLPDGLDIMFLSMDGSRIERVVGFFGPL
jgi:hypothetical protein